MPRILAIDFGLKRVGAALSDPDGKIATPLETYHRRTEALDAAHYKALVAEERVDRIVVGLPALTSGDEGELARQARAFGAWIGRVTGRVVSFHDERYTSLLADEALRGHGLKRNKRKELRDRIAAQILLQSYLESGGPDSHLPLAPLDDPAEEPPLD